MYIGSLSNISTILTGTWTLVGDYGGTVGYSNAVLAHATPTKLAPDDMGSRTRTGNEKSTLLNFLR